MTTVNKAFPNSLQSGKIYGSSYQTINDDTGQKGQQGRGDQDAVGFGHAGPVVLKGHDKAGMHGRQHMGADAATRGADSMAPPTTGRSPMIEGIRATVMRASRNSQFNAPMARLMLPFSFKMALKSSTSSRIRIR